MPRYLLVLITVTAVMHIPSGPSGGFHVAMAQGDGLLIEHMFYDVDQCVDFDGLRRLAAEVTRQRSVGGLNDGQMDTSRDSDRGRRRRRSQDIVMESTNRTLPGCSASRRTEPRPVTPVMMKGACKGAGCPDLNGRRVTMLDCSWSSITDATVVVEETSGWLALWWDDAWTLPVVPRHAEAIAAKGGGEAGYLKMPKAGRIVF